MNRLDENWPAQGDVPVTYVRLLFQYLEQRGVAASKVLREPPPDAGERSARRYPITRWRSLLQMAARHLDDPLLGLHLGRTITPAHFGVMGYVLLACGTLAAAVERMDQYQRLLYDVSPMQRRIEGGSLVLEWGVERGRPGALVDETAITALVQFARDITGSALPPQAVHFVNPPPADEQPYRDYYGCEVRFSQPTTLVKLPLKFLQQPLRQPDPVLLDLLETQAQRLLVELPQADDFEQTVRRCIARLTREGELALERVAQELHLSPRTLHRRLEERGQNFRSLMEDTRRRMAEDYLRDPRLQLSEIAQLLGFSEQSAFSRAFRRWTEGVTPLTFRKALK